VDCQELVELVTDYVEGALTDERAEAVRAHVQECVDCLRYLGQMQLTARLLGLLSTEDLGAATP
jgi:anti-sigma factor RsiW